MSPQAVGPGEGSGPRVSVVVPVYNPGPHIEPCIASLLGQTLPGHDFEAIFVDDGSTDGTAARLDRLAADHSSRIRVIHIPPSGAPGRPRNVGLEAARGRYVQFLDADDALAPDALRRVVAMADRNSSDVVVEKFASASIQRSQRLFERSLERATFAGLPGLADSSLGPAKLYRRAFLRQHGIVFPEGWRLMEDQYVALHAYLRARVISVLADHACYYFLRRDDGGHLTTEAIDPPRHFQNLGRIFDLVEAETRPGPLRDRIIRRLLRVELLARVGDTNYADLSAETRASMFDAARTFLLERIGQQDVRGLDAISRVRCALLREDRPEGLLALAVQLGDLEGTAVLTSAHWRAGVFVVSAFGGLTFSDRQRPLTVTADGGRASLDAALADEPLGRSVDVTREMRALRVDLVTRERRTFLEWNVWAHVGAVVRHRWRPMSRAGRSPARQTAVPVRTSVRAYLDPSRIGGGTTPIASGAWDLLIRISVLGITRFAPLRVAAGPGEQVTCRPALLGDPPRIVVPILGQAGSRLEVDATAAAVADSLDMPTARLLADGDHLAIMLPMAAGPAAGSARVGIAIKSSDGEWILGAILRPWYGHVVLEARVSGLDGLDRGLHPVQLSLRVNDGEIQLGPGRLDGPFRLRMDGLTRLSRAEQVRIRLDWLEAAVRTRSERIGDRARNALLVLGRRIRDRGWI
ncbi:MAG: glycosyltransferase [Candidatus Limnocylindrales bacterium]